MFLQIAVILQLTEVVIGAVLGAPVVLSSVWFVTLSGRIVIHMYPGYIIVFACGL